MSNRKMLVLVSLVLAVLMMAGCNLLPTARKVENGAVIDNLPAKDSLLAKHIPTQVMIRTQDKAMLNKIIHDFHGEITGVIESLDVYKVNVDVSLKGSLVETIKAIAKYSKIDYVEPVYVYEATILDSEYASRQWGPMSIGLEEALELAPAQGSGVVIAIADTGVDYTHPEFDTRVIPGYDVFTGMTGLDETMDYFGHGTHVAGIAAANLNSEKIVGIAPQSSILPVKVLDDGGSGSDYTIAAGICWAVDNGAHVINLSLGGKGYSQAMQDAVDYAVGKNIPVVVAMANTGKNEVMYPAACPGVIAVGATNGNMKVGDFSTRGNHISVSAPGVNIYSSTPGGQYATWNGTSMATPHVAGAIALLLGEEPGLTVSVLKSRLEATATDTDVPGFDANTGHGVINLVDLLSTTVSDVYGSIKVYVEISGWPMSGVDVLVQDAAGLTAANIRTNDNGTAFINNLPAGTYTVRVKVGEQKFSQTVTVTAGTLHTVDFIETVATSLGGYVVNSRGGSGVEGTEVVATDVQNGSTFTAFSGADGAFYMELPAGVYRVDAAKAGLAGSCQQRVHVVENYLTTVNLIQREAFSPVYSTVPPVIELVGLTEFAELTDIVNFTVNVSGENAITAIAVRFGQYDAAEAEVVDANTLDVTFDTTFKPNGSGIINIIAYDVNENVTEWNVPVVYNNASFGYPLPERPELDSIVAMTFGQSLGLFKAERSEVYAKLNLKENPFVVKVKDREYNLESAPDNATIYVTFYWYDVAWADGYKVYRSTSPFGPFALIAESADSKYTDLDPALTPGVRYYYKVAAFNTTGVGPSSEVIETEPMEPFSIALESPANNAANVSLNPTLTWSYTPLVCDSILFWFYLMGTTDAEYTRTWEIYEECTSYNYVGESLVPGKSYEWDIYTGFAVREYSDNSTAVSWSMQGNGSTNGAFIFTTDPDGVPAEKETILEMDIESPDSSVQEIFLEITEEGYYEISTSYFLQDCDTVMTLLDSNYNEVGFNDDFEGSYSSITEQLTPGFYTILIEEYYSNPLYCHLTVNKLAY